MFRPRSDHVPGPRALLGALLFICHLLHLRDARNVRFRAREDSGWRAHPLFLVPLFFTSIVYWVATLVRVRAKQNLEPRAFICGGILSGINSNNSINTGRIFASSCAAFYENATRRRTEMADEAPPQTTRATRRPSEWSMADTCCAHADAPTLLAFAIIFGFIVLIVRIHHGVDGSRVAPFLVLVGGFWILALLTVPILSANAMASERINERLGAILTTPLTTSEILEEWLDPVQRWIGFLVKPMLALFVVEAW